MKNTTLHTTSLHTDFYQLTMSYAYLMSGKASETTGFESFVRHIKPEIAGGSYYYVFNGEENVKEFMARVEREFNSSDFFDKFWAMFSTKITTQEQGKLEAYKKAKQAFEDMDKSFEYTIVKDGTKVYPKVPVFQFKGSKMIGQLIETPITNIINGMTGYASYKNFFKNEEQMVSKIFENMSEIVPTEYIEKLKNRAIEYRNATSKILLEAGYRRAPSFSIAKAASKIAIESGWNGSSNTALYEEVDSSLINGTMAHAFVMAFENEEEAFKTWNSIFPKSTILVDTYDTIKAVEKLIQMQIRPSAVRIDSDPLEELAFRVRDMLDAAGWNEVKIFLSGDITPEKLMAWESQGVPFDMCMAGTKYVNIDEMVNVNCGFVYKIVEYSRNKRDYYPYKKAFGESNYPGLKTVSVDQEGNIEMKIGDKFGFNSMDNISEKAKVRFSSDIDFIAKNGR